jgi:hypothetical protein
VVYGPENRMPGGKVYRTYVDTGRSTTNTEPHPAGRLGVKTSVVDTFSDIMAPKLVQIIPSQS